MRKYKNLRGGGEESFELRLWSPKWLQNTLLWIPDSTNVSYGTWSFLSVTLFGDKKWSHLGCKLKNKNLDVENS